MVQISVNGGNWQDLTEQFSWTSSKAWSSPLVDLTAFAGANVQIGFLFHSENSPSWGGVDVSEGWYIDDIEVLTGPVTMNNPEGFESGIGNWSSEGPWEVGTPNFADGPSESHSGNACFGTRLKGDYEEPPASNLFTENWLISPLFVISDSSKLRFWHWYNFSFGDFGQVYVREENSNWESILGPFSGESGNEWQKEFFDLEEYYGKKIQLGFKFHAENSPSWGGVDVNAGWYIDDIYSNAVLIPADIRVKKTGTTPVPGRKSDYFISVKNQGEETAKNVEILELLNPYHVNLVSYEPLTNIDDSLFKRTSIVYWTISELKPNQDTLLYYKVRIRDTVALGTTIKGTVCEGNDLISQFFQCIQNIGLSFGTCIDCLGQCAVCSNQCTPPLVLVPDVGVLLCVTCMVTTGCFDCMIFNSQGGGVGCIEDNFGSLDDCITNFNNCDEDNQNAQGPVDPNEKEVIANKYIQPNQTLTYPIHFENIGTVEAIDVFVTDTLDENLDLSTLETLTAGGQLIDSINRIVKWSLLNRNLQPGETDNVLLSVNPKPNLPSGTVITNRAKIQFDIFTPLITNEVVNIIDEFPPTSSMNSLPPVVSQTNFPIAWHGVDSIGEIEAYTIFAAEGNGLFSKIANRTKDTTIIFQGQPGKTYHFLCVAEDQAGNIELKQPIAEATTTVDPNATGVKPEIPEEITKLMLYQNYPNPANELTTFSYILPKSGRVELSIFDVYGNKVMQLVSRNQSEGQHAILWDGKNSHGQDVSSGVYFYQLWFENEKIVKKAVLIK